MKSGVHCALLTLAGALPLAAQDDCVFLLGGTKVDAVAVEGYDVFSLRYRKGGSTTVAADQVARVALGRFPDVYRRGLDDPALVLALARTQLEAKNRLLAQLGFLHAAARFLDAGEPAKATGVIEELRRAIPDAAVIPELYRRKFEYCTSLGAAGARDAVQVALQYHSDATRGSWPGGFVAEAELFLVLASPDAAGFADKLRACVAKSDASPLIGNRARLELAHHLRKNKDFEGARRIYDEVQNRDGIDASSRAGALLGLGLLLLDQPAADTAVFKQALLLFLRVRLETRDARPGLQAEALHHAIVAADKWRGPEYTLIMSRCRRQLLDEFPSTQWAKQAKEGL